MHSYRSDLSLLKDRRFALLMSARAISVLGGSFAPVALAFGVLGLPGANAGTLSVVLTAGAVPMVAFMLVGGVIADRLPRQRVMLVGEIMNAVTYLSLAAMLITGWTPVPALAAAAAFGGVGLAIFFPAMTGIIPEVVPADRLQAANGIIGLGTNSSRIAGFVAGGGAVALLGPGWALIASGLLFTVAACLIALLGHHGWPRPNGTQRHSVLADLREGWQVFISKQWLWVVVAQFSVLVMALQGAHGVLGPVVAQQELGGAAAWSAVLAGEAVGMVVGVVIAIRMRPTRPILVATLMMFPIALPYLLLGLGTPLWTVVGAAVISGICLDIFGVLWNTTMQREIPPEALSRVSSYDALGSLMFGPIGLFVAGPVAIWIGPRPALLACAAVVVLSTAAALLSPGVRQLRAPVATPDPVLVTSQ
ncbi:MAG TPA: MFS transporter [Micromonosporaceae bacterium]|nr:MFS transporter [Micromonosporaceae bacterium]